jgi:hypothetical protein
MKVRFTLQIRCAGPAECKALEGVLTPDGKVVPKGLRLTASRTGGTLAFSGGSESPSTALSTAVSLLWDVALFNEVWLLSTRREAEGQEEE